MMMSEHLSLGESTWSCCTRFPLTWMPLHRSYMPTYELFSRYVESPEAPWTGKGLKVGLDIKRDVTGVDNF